QRRAQRDGEGIRRFDGDGVARFPAAAVPAGGGGFRHHYLHLPVQPVGGRQDQERTQAVLGHSRPQVLGGRHLLRDLARGGVALGRMFWKGGDAAVIDGVLIDGSASTIKRIASG